MRTSPRVGRVESFEDLDGRRLARAVRAEQAEALPAHDVEVEPVDGFDVGVVLLQALAGDGQVVSHARANDSIVALIRVMRAILVDTRLTLSNSATLASPAARPATICASPFARRR